MSLLQKTPSSPVCCHATGFYPDRATLFWRKDGEDLHEEVDLGEILPNHDGSFQMSADLNLSSVTPEDWRRYDCVFRLSGVKDDIVTRLDKVVIKTNRGKTEIRSEGDGKQFFSVVYKKLCWLIDPLSDWDLCKLESMAPAHGSDLCSIPSAMCPSWSWPL